MEATPETVEETDEEMQLIKKPSFKFKDSILVKTFSFGLNSLFFAGYLSANGRLLSMLGENEAAASALVLPYLAVSIHACSGLLLSTGLQIGTAIAKNDYKEAGDIVKTSWVLSGALGLVSSGVMLATRGFLPAIFEEKIAHAAVNFFTGFAPIGIPILLIGTNFQIAFQADDWYVPPIAGLLFAAIGGGSAYLLAFPAKLGPFGVGLGGTISAVTTTVGLQLWFLRPHYKEFALYTLSISEFPKKVKDFLGMGWKLSLQRISEWANLMLITTVLGIGTNKYLKAAQPSIQYTSLLAATIQGLAQATGMITKRNVSALEKAKITNNELEAKKWHKKNIRTVIVMNTAAGIVSSGIATAFYFARKPLVEFFLPISIDPLIKEEAETLLWINMLGLIPDSIRIVSSGALRGWDSILFPTIVSIILMIVIGIPTGWGLGTLFEKKAEIMFYARDIAMFISAGIIVDQCRRKLLFSSDNNDTFSVENLEHIEEDSQATESLQYSERYMFLSQQKSSVLGTDNQLILEESDEDIDATEAILNENNRIN